MLVSLPVKGKEDVKITKSVFGYRHKMTHNVQFLLGLKTGIKS